MTTRKNMTTSMNTIMTMSTSTITTTDILMNTATSTAGRAKTGK